MRSSVRAPVSIRKMSNSAADSIDDLVSSFSRTHINDVSQSKPRKHFSLDEPSALPSKLPSGCENQEFDEVVSAVRNLRIEPEDPYSDKHVVLDDRCMRLAGEQLVRWGIPKLALENLLELARGNPNFPIIMLLNPSDGSEDQQFPDMVEKSPTLLWIRDVLAGIGLDISDVSILDICPLLSARRLGVIGFSERADAIDQAYGLTKEILKYLKPKILLSCQCGTRQETWNAARNALAYELCSSVNGAENGEVKVIKMEGHAIQVIQAFHPMHILYQQDYSIRAEKNTILENMFKRVYSSCASRKGELLLVIEASKVVSSFRSYLAVVKEGKEEIFEMYMAASGEGVNLQPYKVRLSSWLSECEAAKVAFHESLRTSRNMITEARTADRRRVATLPRKV